MLILDQAGWHFTPKLKVPDNITLTFLPPRSPELNPVENVWQFMRDNWLSNGIFKDCDDIVDQCCRTWTGSSISRARSRPSDCAIGRMPVDVLDGWAWAVGGAKGRCPRRRDQNTPPGIGCRVFGIANWAPVDRDPHRLFVLGGLNSRPHLRLGAAIEALTSRQRSKIPSSMPIIRNSLTIRPAGITFLSVREIVWSRVGARDHGRRILERRRTKIGRSLV